MFSFQLMLCQWFYGEVKRYLRDNTSIRVSRSIKDLAFKVIQFKEKFNKEHSREPTIDEISNELRVTKEDIVFSLDVSRVKQSNEKKAIISVINVNKDNMKLNQN